MSQIVRLSVSPDAATREISLSCLHSLFTHHRCQHLASSVDFSPLLGPEPLRLAVYELLLRSSLTSPSIQALCSYPPR